MSDPRLIAVLRRPLGIVALVSHRHRPFHPPGGDDADPYGEVVAALGQIPEPICPWRDKDVRAWRAVARVPNMSRRAGLAIVRAVIGSVADPEFAPESELAALRFERNPVDLRPYLCDAAGEQMLLDELGDVLDKSSEDTDFPEWHWHCRADIAALPPTFRRTFLWGLHLSPWPIVEATLAAYKELGLEHDAALRRAVSRLLSYADRYVGLGWCDLLAAIDPELRVGAAEVAIETRGWIAHPSDEAREALGRGRWGDACSILANAA